MLYVFLATTATRICAIDYCAGPLFTAFSPQLLHSTGLYIVSLLPTGFDLSSLLEDDEVNGEEEEERK